MPDPDRMRLLKEASELNVKFPGLGKIIKHNRTEWPYIVCGFFGCVLTGAITPVFAFFYSEMFAVRPLIIYGYFKEAHSGITLSFYDCRP